MAERQDITIINEELQLQGGLFGLAGLNFIKDPFHFALELALVVSHCSCYKENKHARDHHIINAIFSLVLRGIVRQKS